MEHPLKNELFLLKKTIERIPFTYPEKEKKEFEDKYHLFEANQEVKREDIDNLVIEIGKATWPHRKAYEEFVRNYAQDKLEEYFKMHLDKAVLGKYEEFVKQGGNIKDYRRTKDFEEYFTPEENMAIEKALFTAHDEVKIFLQGIINDKRSEYEESLKIFEQKQKDLANMIASLKEIAAKSEKWAPEILDKIKKFEEGWSVVERDFDEDKLKHEIEYWQGVTGLE